MQEGGGTLLDQLNMQLLISLDVLLFMDSMTNIV